MLTSEPVSNISYAMQHWTEQNQQNVVKDTPTVHSDTEEYKATCTTAHTCVCARFECKNSPTKIFYAKSWERKSCYP